MKSAPNITRETPGTANKADASWERAASLWDVNSSGWPVETSRPGRNFNVAGFGVASVWMNMYGRPAESLLGRY
jgi:hypothetical protein